MASQEQVSLAQEFIRKSFQGEVDDVVDYLDPNVTYIVPGNHELAGVFHGPRSVADHMQKLLEFTDNRVDLIQWEDWMVGLNNIAALIDLRLQRPGRIETFRAIFLIAMSDQDCKIRRLQVFFGDQNAAERFFEN
jgi:ketosteroid isomerase-like protein